MDNTTPDGQSQFIAGPFPGEPVSYGGYRGLISANLPARASHITMSGAGPLAVKGAGGPHLGGGRAGDHPPGGHLDGGGPLRDARPATGR